MDLDKKHRQVTRGMKVKEWLDDPLFNEPFEQMEKFLRDDWENTGGGDSERREDIWRTLKLLENIKQRFRVIAENGKAANDDLLKLKK